MHTIKEVLSVLQSYWTFREELTIEDAILKGTRIVIPAKKDENILKLIHEGHLGLNKYKLHAKETIGQDLTISLRNWFSIENSI